MRSILAKKTYLSSKRRFNKIRFYERGFTLIELLTVIAVIGVLAGIVIIGINPTQRTAEARDTIRKTDLQFTQKALEVYYIKNQRYPSSGCISAPTNPGWQCWNINSVSFLMGGLTGKNYLARMPIDPRNYDSGLACGTGVPDTSFLYSYYGGGATYVLYSRLENLTDPLINYNGVVSKDPSTCTNWANYKITNP